MNKTGHPKLLDYDKPEKPRNRLQNYLDLVPEHFVKVVMSPNYGEPTDYHHIEVYNSTKIEYGRDGKWENYGYGIHFYIPLLVVNRSLQWRHKNLFQGSVNGSPLLMPDPNDEELINATIQIDQQRRFVNSREFYDVNDDDEVYVAYTEKLGDWDQKKLAPYCQCNYHRFSFWNPLKFLYDPQSCGCIRQFDNKMPPQSVIDSTRRHHHDTLHQEK